MLVTRVSHSRSSTASFAPSMRCPVENKGGA
jgi:hypothetical protein